MGWLADRRARKEEAEAAEVRRREEVDKLIADQFQASRSASGSARINASEMNVPYRAGKCAMDGCTYKAKEDGYCRAHQKVDPVKNRKAVRDLQKMLDDLQPKTK